MKGVVLSIAPQATLVDIAHGVPARDVAAGAVALAQAAPLFPPGTIHVAVVDPGVGGARADIWWSPPVTASTSAPTTACCRWPPAAPRRIYRIEAPGVSARAGQPDVSRPRRVRAGRRPAGRRRAPPRTPARPSRSMVELERAAAAPARRRGRGGGDSRRRRSATSSPRCRPRWSQRRGRPTRPSRSRRGPGRFEPSFGRTFSDVETGRAHRLHRQRRPAGDRAPRRLRRPPPGRRARHDRPRAEPDVVKARGSWFAVWRSRWPRSAAAPSASGSGSANGTAVGRRLRQRLDGELRDARHARGVQPQRRPSSPATPIEDLVQGPQAMNQLEIRMAAARACCRCTPTRSTSTS